MFVPTTIFSKFKRFCLKQRRYTCTTATLDMSNLFVAFIFVAFACNCYHILAADTHGKSGESSSKIVDEGTSSAGNPTPDVVNQDASGNPEDAASTPKADEFQSKAADELVGSPKQDVLKDDAFENQEYTKLNSAGEYKTNVGFETKGSQRKGVEDAISQPTQDVHKDVSEKQENAASTSNAGGSGNDDADECDECDESECHEEECNEDDEDKVSIRQEDAESTTNSGEFDDCEDISICGESKTDDKFSESEDTSSVSNYTSENDETVPIVLGYHPIIIIANRDELFATASDTMPVFPLTTEKIVSYNYSPAPHEEKIHLCPYMPWMNTLYFHLPSNTDTNYLNMEIKSNQGEITVCEELPKIARIRFFKSSDLINCPAPSMGLFSQGLLFGYPMIKKYEVQIKRKKNNAKDEDGENQVEDEDENEDENEDEDENKNDEEKDKQNNVEDKDKQNKDEKYTYRVTDMLSVFYELEAKYIQVSDVYIETRMLEIYRYCQDLEQNRVSWIQRNITPWTELERPIYSINENNRSTTQQSLVPKTKSDSPIWASVIQQSYETDVTILDHFKPLIDLIEDRLQLYSTKKDTFITVMAKIIYPAFEEKQIVHMINNVKFVEPETLLIQAYDTMSNSAITFIIHHTLDVDKKPEESPFCKERAECDFVKWANMSSFFKTHKRPIEITNNFAYCCKTTTDDIKMPLNIQPNDVLKLDWEPEEDAEKDLNKDIEI